MGRTSILALFKEHLRRITLEERLQRNPVYPFHKVHREDQMYELELRQNSAYYFLVTTILCIASVIICGNLGQYEYLTVFAFVLISSIYLTIEHWPMVRVVINHNTETYSVHRGSTLMYEGGLHNIALKMIEIGSSALTMYQIILEAHLLELQISISYKMKSRDTLKHNALLLSDNLGINYFDSHLPSKRHIVRHRKEG
ncbi:putative membrane protein [Oopsacas minuta]|uniref:Membrane protein n=1 Tax=Oopsacas minuta TaxID=111878 RepID=A0AAV7JCP1_9METZ|nr:putative membrane protein [Oopsacas minuta]